MMPEHKLLLALSAILKPSYPHLEDLHAEVEKRAAEYRLRDESESGDAGMPDVVKRDAVAAADPAGSADPNAPADPKPGEEKTSS